MSNFPYPEYEHSTNVPPTFYRRDISAYTSAQVEALIFHGAVDHESREMPEWIATQVVKHNHFSKALRDWATESY